MPSYGHTQYTEESMGPVIVTMLNVSQNQSLIKLQKATFSFLLKESSDVFELYGFRKYKFNAKYIAIICI